MINKIYKIIHNKYYRFFKFIFFLRYLIAIFFVASALFLFIPQLFDYQKKEKIIKNYLVENYGIEITKVESIKFNSFPIPNLELNNLKANFNFKDNIIETQKMNIYPKLFSIYNFKNFDVKKIRLNDNNIIVNFEEFKALFLYLYNQKKKINLNNLNIQIKDQNNKIISLKKINFFNYGYKRDEINGEVFSKKFNVNLIDNLNKIEFNLLNTGLSFNLDLKKKDDPFSYSGSLKGKVLSSNFKLNFTYNKDSLKIKKLFFRDKNLAFQSDGSLILKPFFKIHLDNEIKNINKDIFNLFNINYLLNLKDLIKRLNSQINIVYNSKKFSRDLIDSLNLQTQLAYGRLNFVKDFSISESRFNCEGSVNLIDEYPILNYKCKLKSPDKKKLLKKINVDYKNKNEKLSLIIQGNLNILNNKINFDYLEINDFKAKKEDLKFFKDNFENIVFNENFLKMFKITKIKKFILEIS